MLTGPILIVILICAIALIILLTAKLKLHAFVSLILVSFLVAICSGLPINPVSGENQSPGIIAIIASGFGNTLTSIGIVIVLGTIIGSILEKSGAALKMADVVVKVIGKKNPALAMSIIGYIVSIPVFCDSGYVIISPLRKALAKRSGASSVAMAIALSTGLYATHVMVPPTPGPIAAAANLGLANNLILVIAIGLVVAIPATIAGLIFARIIGKKVTSSEDLENAESYEDLLKRYGKLPNGFAAFAPIVVPIVLMALGSVAKFPGNPFGTGAFQDLLVFLGTPISALFVGFLFALLLMKKFDEETLTGWIGEGVKAAGTILIITGAGGSLGAVLKETNVAAYLGQSLATLNIGIFVPFIVAAAIKTAQGSSTVAIVTTSAMLAPMMTSLGFGSDIARTLVVMAIGAGSMTVSHANDSYFWVVSEFSGLKLSNAYKTQTLGTLVQGIVSIIFIFIISLFLVR